MTANKKTFRIRAFTAMMMLWSFIIETVSGVVLYIVPPGRVANWTNWKLWGVTKHGWGSIHTILGYVFLVFACLHIYYNWKPIVSYIKRRVKSGIRLRAELTVSVLVTLIVTVLTIAAIPPFSSVMDLGESFKNSWEDNQNQPFVIHAELFTLYEFVRQVDIPLEQALDILRTQGVQVEDPGADVASIARQNGTSPSRIYEYLRSGLSVEGQKKMDDRMTGSQAVGRKIGGGGLGWKTIEQIASELNIPVERVMAFLKEEGIEAEQTDVVRAAAEKNDMRPYDLVNLIRKKAGIEQ
jgi:hypothetical protein